MKVKRYGRIALALIPAALIIAAVIVLFFVGIRKVKFEGLLAKLFGTSPETRTGPNGPIPVGEPDSKGIVEAEVKPIEDTGLFDPDDEVTIVDDGIPITVELPDGVDNGDVSKVIVAKPTLDNVYVEDTSSVSPQEVSDLISKYKRP